jgi:hypothetical protein
MPPTSRLHDALALLRHLFLAGRAELLACLPMQIFGICLLRTFDRCGALRLGRGAGSRLSRAGRMLRWRRHGLRKRGGVSLKVSPGTT